MPVSQRSREGHLKWSFLGQRTWARGGRRVEAGGRWEIEEVKQRERGRAAQTHVSGRVWTLVVVQSLSRVRLSVTPWTAARQASLSFTSSHSLLRLVSIKSVIPSNHLILSCPLLLPSIFPSIGVFSNESALCKKRPKYWTLSLNSTLSNEYSRLISFN